MAASPPVAFAGAPSAPAVGMGLPGEDTVLKKLQGLQEMERVPVVRFERGRLMSERVCVCACVCVYTVST